VGPGTEELVPEMPSPKKQKVPAKQTKGKSGVKGVGATL
jgi:hypothetical protein